MASDRKSDRKQQKEKQEVNKDAEKEKLAIRVTMTDGGNDQNLRHKLRTNRYNNEMQENFHLCLCNKTGV